MTNLCVKVMILFFLCFFTNCTTLNLTKINRFSIDKTQISISYFKSNSDTVMVVVKPSYVKDLAMTPKDYSYSIRFDKPNNYLVIAPINFKNSYTTYLEKGNYDILFAAVGISGIKLKNLEFLEGGMYFIEIKIDNYEID